MREPKRPWIGVQEGIGGLNEALQSRIDWSRTQEMGTKTMAVPDKQIPLENCELCHHMMLFVPKTRSNKQNHVTTHLSEGQLVSSISCEQLDGFSWLYRQI